MGKSAGISKEAVPNQVFVGLPWKTVRPKYERVIARLRVAFPLSYVIVGRDDEQDAEDLLAVIKDKLFSSSHAIFDATDGNANVSLEYGLAEAKGIPRTLYLCTHGRGSATRKDRPIISDLAGKRRMPYTVENRLRTLLSTFSRKHDYTIRFERFMTARFKRLKKGPKRRARYLALKVIHALDEQESVRREDIMFRLQADSAQYREPEVDGMIKALHGDGLLISSAGRYSNVSMI